MPISKFRSNKNTLGGFIASLFDGTFWFGDFDINVADKVLTKGEAKIRTIKTISISELGKNKKVKEIDTLIPDLTPVIPLAKGEVLHGYIKLTLKNTDVNQIFLKHNITLKYINVSGQMYIKSLVMGNTSSEIDCYSEGENESLTIEKVNDSSLLITLLEKDGQAEVLNVINGVGVY